MADQRIRAIYGGIPRSEIQYHWGEISETYVLRFGGFFIAWLLGCFALAAIATVVNDLDADDGSEIWRRDSYQRAREHFGPLLSAALCTFCAFIAGVVVVGFVELSLVRALRLAHSWRANVGVILVGYILVASILSWFGMAIPLILSGDIGPWRALKRSVKLSNGYEGFLFLLVVESLAGSYVAWYAVHYGLTFLFPTQLQHTVWYGWLVYGLAIVASAAVQPPMFIGFSLLASCEVADSLLPRSQEAADID
jgi:small-conductance mechanosensitive channel